VWFEIETAWTGAPTGAPIEHEERAAYSGSPIRAVVEAQKY
jgi:hypothetical protein